MTVERIAGRYVRQAAGYRAFMPEPLPPVPDIEIDAETQALLSKADRALGRLDGSIQTLPNPELFVFMFSRARLRERRRPSVTCWRSKRRYSILNIPMTLARF
jgi:hypothetical protein